MSDLYGAPSGIIASDEVMRKNALGMLESQKTLGEIAMQPADMALKEAHARLFNIEASAKESEIAAAETQQKMLQEFSARRQLVQGKAAQGEIATVADLDEAGSARPKSQADELEAFADFLDAHGAISMSAPIRKSVAGIRKDEAIGADHNARAATHALTDKINRAKFVGQTAGTAALSPQDYLTIMGDPDKRKLIPQQLSGDFYTDVPVLKAIERAGIESAKRMELTQRAIMDEARKARWRNANAKDAETVNLRKVQVDEARERLKITKKYSGELAEETIAGKRELRVRRKALQEAQDRKEFGPIPLNPDDREPDKIYRNKAKKLLIWRNDGSGNTGWEVYKPVGSAAPAPDTSDDSDDTDED